MSTRRYFGTDGIRGRVGEAPITPELVLKLGYAAGRILAMGEGARTGEAPRVLIGKDTRISGYLLEAALEAGLSAAGVDVDLTGPLPTPAVAYLTRALRLSAGIVISASHNPFDDNGIKFFSAAGTKLPDEVEVAIEAQMDAPLDCVPSARLGKARRIEDAAARYIEFCKSTFPNELNLRGMRIVVDCAHGAQIGIALDGDGDRLLIADDNGRTYDGDQLLYIIAMDYRRRGVLAGGVVGTLMSNLGFEQALDRSGVTLIRARVGDRYVLEKMVENHALLGGENSGHLICRDRHTTGDAIIAALAVLRALIEQGTTLAQATEAVVMFPQTLINVPIRRGWDWRNSETVLAAENHAIASLGDAGRVLLRPSGTEPVLRVMVEARDASLADAHAQAIAGVIATAAGQRL